MADGIPKLSVTSERRGTLKTIDIENHEDTLLPVHIPTTPLSPQMLPDIQGLAISSAPPSPSPTPSEQSQPEIQVLNANPVTCPAYANVQHLPEAPPIPQPRQRRPSFLKEVQGFFENLGKPREKSKERRGSISAPKSPSQEVSFNSGRRATVAVSTLNPVLDPEIKSAPPVPNPPTGLSPVTHAPLVHSNTLPLAHHQAPPLPGHVVNRTSTLTSDTLLPVGGLPLRRYQTMPEETSDDNSSISSTVSGSTRGRTEGRQKKKHRKFSLSPFKRKEGEELRRFKSEDDRQAGTLDSNRGTSRDRRRSVGDFFGSLFGSERRRKDELDDEIGVDDDDRSRTGSWWRRLSIGGTGSRKSSIKSRLSEVWVEPPLPPIQLLGRTEEKNTVLDVDTANELRKSLPPRLRDAFKWQLLFSLEQNGMSMTTMYFKLKDRGPCVLAIKDDTGAIFGAFISESIEIQPPGKGFYGTGEMFLWDRWDPLPIPMYATLQRQGSFDSTKLDDDVPSPRVKFAEPSASSRQGSVVENSTPPMPIVATTSQSFTSPYGSPTDEDIVQMAQSILSNPLPPTVRVTIHRASLSNDYFLSTRYDSVIMGGDEDGHIALEFARNLLNGSSDGRCKTYDLNLCPLGCRLDNSPDHLHVLGDGKSGIRNFKIVNLEFWGIDYEGTTYDIKDLHQTKAEALEELGLDGRSKFAKEL